MAGVNKQILFNRRINCGLSVPNLQAYYVAANLASISFIHETQHLPLWATIDMIDSHSIPLSSLPWLPPSSHPKGISPSLSHTLHLWDSIKYPTGLISPHLTLLRFINCPLFSPGMDSPGQFGWWTDHGFSDVHSLLTPVRIITFEALCSSHELALQEHYRYLQLHHFLQRLLRSHSTHYLLSAFEGICRSCPHSMGIISLIYSSITSSRKPPRRPFQQHWEPELSVRLEPADWQIMLQAASKSSRNVVTLENAYNVIYQWYYTPARLAQIMP